MDFKALRDKILPNIEHYNKEEVKIVVAKLLEFLIDIDNKNKNLKNEIEELKKQQTKLLDVDLTSVNEEKEIIIQKAKKEAQKVYDEIIESAIDKVNDLIRSIKQKDEENKLYRKHILSIFRRSIFRFSNTNYYILKTDDQEFQELVKFFKVDEELQKLCDENIKKLMQNEKYQETIHKVETEGLTLSNEIQDVEEIEELNEIEDLKLTEFEIDDMEFNEVEGITLADIEEELSYETPQKKAKFLDILNQYKNK